MRKLKEYWDYIFNSDIYICKLIDLEKYTLNYIIQPLNEDFRQRLNVVEMSSYHKEKLENSIVVLVEYEYKDFLKKFVKDKEYIENKLLSNLILKYIFNNIYLKFIKQKILNIIESFTIYKIFLNMFISSYELYKNDNIIIKLKLNRLKNLILIINYSILLINIYIIYYYKIYYYLLLILIILLIKIIQIIMEDLLIFFF